MKKEIEESFGLKRNESIKITILKALISSIIIFLIIFIFKIEITGDKLIYPYSIIFLALLFIFDFILSFIFNYKKSNKTSEFNTQGIIRVLMLLFFYVIFLIIGVIIIIDIYKIIY